MVIRPFKFMEVLLCSYLLPKLSRFNCFNHSSIPSRQPSHYYLIFAFNCFQFLSVLALFCTAGMSKDLRACEETFGPSSGLLDEPRHRVSPEAAPQPQLLWLVQSKDRCAASLMSGQQVKVKEEFGLELQ